VRAKVKSALDRTPPQAIQAEQAVLGCILLDGTAESMETARGILEPTDFYRAPHKSIFIACRHLHDAGRPTDLLTVSEELERLGELDRTGGRPYLAACQDLVPAVSRVGHYAESVKRASDYRKLIDIAGDMFGRAYDQEVEPSGIVEDAALRLVASLNGHAENLTAILSKARVAASFFREFDFGELPGIGSLSALDSLPLLGRPGYIVRGWSHLLAGYPKAGKTELMFDCVREWAAMGIRTAWFSEEGEAVWSARRAKHPDFPANALQVVVAIGTGPMQLLGRAREGSEDVVILDTLRNLLGITDENDNAEVARALGCWEARLAGKTRLYIHHQRKQGGEHGQAIAGGAAFLGIVDRAIEIRFDPSGSNRRRLVVSSRITPAPDLLYEMREDESLIALGEPGQVSFEELKDALREALQDEWQTTTEIHAALPDPCPVKRTVERALKALMELGDAERDPAADRRGARYTWRLAGAETAADPGETGDPGVQKVSCDRGDSKIAARLGASQPSELRARLLALAEAGGWPRVRVGGHMRDTEVSWRYIVACGSDEEIVSAITALEKR
jgi:hypothetical protein